MQFIYVRWYAFHLLDMHLVCVRYKSIHKRNKCAPNNFRLKYHMISDIFVSINMCDLCKLA